MCKYDKCVKKGDILVGGHFPPDPVHVKAHFGVHAREALHRAAVAPRYDAAQDAAVVVGADEGAAGVALARVEVLLPGAEHAAGDGVVAVVALAG